MSKKTTKETTTALAPRDPNVAMEPWEKELEAEAQKAKDSVADIGGGLFASIKGGKLTIGDNVIPGNQLACIVLAHCAGKTYYPTGYNPKVAESPKCYAFGPTLKGMVPHKEADAPQHPACDDCKHNVFGTAITGNGKACKDSIRMVFIEGGSLGTNGVFIPYTDKPSDLGRLQKNEAVKLSIPPTSLGAFAKYVRAIAETSKRPLYGVHTLIKVAMTSKGGADYPEVSFECLGMVSKDQIGVLRARASAAEPELSQPYPKMGAKKDADTDEDEPTTSKAGGKKSKGGKF
jgi:hypothetical protein